jgi:hypothetical protein
VPATLHWLAPWPPGPPHVPFWLVPVFTQSPLQHWVFAKQMSPVCVQYETAAEHTPLVQRPEQQSEPRVQPLPDVRQPPPGLIGAHLPLLQMPLQHAVPDVQLPATGLSGTQALAAHVWFEPQKPEQQSPRCAHDAPTALHAPPPGALQTFGVGTPQMPPFAQVAPPPHWIRAPHPSGTKPQVRPAHAVAALAGWHCPPPPQTLGTPPPPHTPGAAHVPQSAVSPPQPSATWPQFFPRSAHVLGVHAPPSGPTNAPPPHTLG